LELMSESRLGFTIGVLGEDGVDWSRLVAVHLGDARGRFPRYKHVSTLNTSIHSCRSRLLRSGCSHEASRGFTTDGFGPHERHTNMEASLFVLHFWI
jgi:hypothetical protein